MLEGRMKDAMMPVLNSYRDRQVKVNGKENGRSERWDAIRSWVEVDESWRRPSEVRRLGASDVRLLVL